MTHAAALGGASSSCRGGAVRGGGGRQRTTSVSESPDALRQWLTVAMAPDWLSLQAAHRGLRGGFGGPKKRRAWHPSFDTVGVLALRSPPADHFASRQEERLQRPWPGCRARAALAALAGGRITAPERCARHDVPQRRLVEARTPWGGRVACVERPLHDAPHAQRR